MAAAAAAGAGPGPTADAVDVEPLGTHAPCSAQFIEVYNLLCTVVGGAGEWNTHQHTIAEVLHDLDGTISEPLKRFMNRAIAAASATASVDAWATTHRLLEAVRSSATPSSAGVEMVATLTKDDIECGMWLSILAVTQQLMVTKAGASKTIHTKSPLFEWMFSNDAHRRFIRTGPSTGGAASHAARSALAIMTLLNLQTVTNDDAVSIGKLCLNGGVRTAALNLHRWSTLEASGAVDGWWRPGGIDGFGYNALVAAANAGIRAGASTQAGRREDGVVVSMYVVPKTQRTPVAPLQAGASAGAGAGAGAGARAGASAANPNTGSAWVSFVFPAVATDTTLVVCERDSVDVEVILVPAPSSQMAVRHQVQLAKGVWRRWFGGSNIRIDKVVLQRDGGRKGVQSEGGAAIAASMGDAVIRTLGQAWGSAGAGTTGAGTTGAGTTSGRVFTGAEVWVNTHRGGSGGTGTATTPPSKFLLSDIAALLARIPNGMFPEAAAVSRILPGVLVDMGCLWGCDSCSGGDSTRSGRTPTTSNAVLSAYFQPPMLQPPVPATTFELSLARILGIRPWSMQLCLAPAIRHNALVSCVKSMATRVRSSAGDKEAAVAATMGPQGSTMTITVERSNGLVPPNTAMVTTVVITPNDVQSIVALAARLWQATDACSNTTRTSSSPRS